MKKTVTKKESSIPFLALGVGATLLLFSLAVFLLPPVAIALIQNYLSQTTGLSVKIRKLSLNLARSQFSIKDLEFSNSTGFPEAPFARIGKVRMHYLPPATLGGGFELKKVEVDFKEFWLVRNEAGTLNLPALRPLPAKGKTIEELVFNLDTVAYADLSGGQPVQQTFDVKLEKATYRKVKGIPGILEILNWEILKRTGVEERTGPPIPEIKPTPESGPVPAPAVPPASSSPPKPEESTEPTK